MKQLIKSNIKSLASIIGRHKWKPRQPNLLILAYHRILPKSDPRYLYEQPTMVVTPETFDQNLAWTAKYFEFISLSQWLKGFASNTLEAKNYCAITFDDGWIDNLYYALPVLEKYRAPATIYCVANMLEGKQNYWPGLLTTLIRECARRFPTGSYLDKSAFDWLKHACQNRSDINWTAPLTRDIDIIVELVKIYRDLEIFQHIEETRSALNLDYCDERQLLNVTELKAMIATGLIEIGSHTSHHIRLTSETQNDVLHREIVDSKKILAQLLDVDIETFCYPNGYHPENAANMVGQHYLGACTLEKGWNSCHSNTAKLRRVSLHETTARNKNHFHARLSGWI